VLRLQYVFLRAFHPEKHKELLDRLWRDQLCAKCLPQCRLNNSSPAREVCKFATGTHRSCFRCECLPSSACIPRYRAATRRSPERTDSDLHELS
jgi:hypothetical protein